MKYQSLSLSTSEKVALISNMHTMLAAGIPILETVDSLSEDAKGNVRKILSALREDVGQGQHVYFTFAKFPRVFDSVTVNIIKASEEAGTLDVALNDLRDNIRKEAEFADRIRAATIYPAFIMVVFSLVLLVILIVVVPKVATVFSRLNVVLPLPTKILIFLSNILLTYTLPIVLLLGGLIAGIIYLYRRHKQVFIRALISLPLISRLAEEIDLTRFARSLYLLLNAGLPITVALHFSQDVVNKSEIKKSIEYAKNAVFEGKKLSLGFKEYKQHIPPIMIKIIEAGERSGSLDKSMLDISEYLEYRVSNTLKTVTALLEPLLLVVVGIMVGAMMMAIIAPIYNVIGQVGPR